MIASDDWSRADSVAHGREHYDFAFNGHGEETRTSEDELLAVASGVFWRGPLLKPDTLLPPRTLDEISRADGSSQTILLSENLNTRSFDPATHTEVGSRMRRATSPSELPWLVAKAEADSRSQTGKPPAAWESRVDRSRPGCS